MKCRVPVLHRARVIRHDLRAREVADHVGGPVGSEHSRHARRLPRRIRMRVAFAARLRARIASRLAGAGRRHRRLGRVPGETCTPGVEARSGIAGPARVQHPKRVACGRFERATGPCDMSERACRAFVGADRHSYDADCVERLHVVRVQRQRCEQRLFGILVLAAHCRHTALHEQGSCPQPVTDARPCLR